MGTDCSIYSILDRSIDEKILDRWWVFSSKFTEGEEPVSYEETHKRLKELINKPNVGTSAWNPVDSANYATYWVNEALKFVEENKECKFLILSEHWNIEDVEQKYFSR